VVSHESVPTRRFVKIPRWASEGWCCVFGYLTIGLLVDIDFLVSGRQLKSLNDLDLFPRSVLVVRNMED
jgi:hypothetical protein